MVYLAFSLVFLWLLLFQGVAAFYFLGAALLVYFLKVIFSK